MGEAVQNFRFPDFQKWKCGSLLWSPSATVEDQHRKCDFDSFIAAQSSPSPSSNTSRSARSRRPAKLRSREHLWTSSPATLHRLRPNPLPISAGSSPGITISEVVPLKGEILRPRRPSFPTGKFYQLLPFRLGHPDGSARCSASTMRPLPASEANWSQLDILSNRVGGLASMARPTRPRSRQGRRRSFGGAEKQD